MMSCNTGFHDRCFDDVCGCLCGHRALRESVPAPKPASEHVALQTSINEGRTQIFMIDGVEHFRTVDEDGGVTVTTLQ